MAAFDPSLSSAAMLAGYPNDRMHAYTVTLAPAIDRPKPLRSGPSSRPQDRHRAVLQSHSGDVCFRPEAGVRVYGPLA
jgi:hypothetical protein